MATVLKAAGLCFAAWLVPVAVSFLMVVVAAGVTERWRAASAQWIVPVVLLAEVALFAAGSFLLWRGLSSFLTAGPIRALLFGLHAFLQLATLAIMGFSTLVAFNR
jgi:hypothetical protein